MIPSLFPFFLNSVLEGALSLSTPDAFFIPFLF
jgi:hypothetical protein